MNDWMDDKYTCAVNWLPDFNNMVRVGIRVRFNCHMKPTDWCSLSPDIGPVWVLLLICHKAPKNQTIIDRALSWHVYTKLGYQVDSNVVCVCLSVINYGCDQLLMEMFHFENYLINRPPLDIETNIKLNLLSRGTIELVISSRFLI